MPARAQDSILKNALTALLAAALLTLLVTPATADTFPPDWNGSCGASPACHYAPVAWPADDGDGLTDYGDWIPYTMVGSGIEDNATQDPSNGGTSPQNYVNISSGCTDLTLPSVLLYYDSANQVLMFRWRVEQIAHSYAVGPSAKPASSVDPWKSALWTVLIDIDGDGYREYAVQVDGSSGTPGADIDRIIVSYSNSPDQSVDYEGRSDICLVSHNPTAFTEPIAAQPDDGFIQNFHNSVSPDTLWTEGAGETLWDYGTTRARLLDQGSCIEYFVDYQIPLAALDAAGLNEDGTCPSEAPAVTESTPLCVLFTTSNSLENPLQKDVVMEPPDTPGQTCVLDPNEPAPYGDCFALGDFDADTGDLGTIDAPIVQTVDAVGCGPTTLTATVSDSVDPQSCYDTGTIDTSVTSVRFYYYRDLNGNGDDDDPDNTSWVAGPVATQTSTGVWQASGWDTTGLRQGLYLIGVRAEDAQGNVTWSHLTQAEVDLLFPGDDANPSTPGQLADSFVNSCGTAPSIGKTASVTEVPIGGPVDFTITIAAATDQALSLDQIDDFLPSGWTYDSDQGGTLTPSTSPSFGASGTISWTFPPTVIAAGTTRTLIFRATAPLVTGSYSNSAQYQSSNEGILESDPVQVGVGAPVLNIAKSVDVLSPSPGDTVTYTITYANLSPISVNNAVITDTLPTELTFVSATGGGTYDGGSRTITWNVGTLASGEGPFSVTFDATIADPWAADGPSPLVNTATIDSDETNPANASANVFVTLPLAIQKSGGILVAPGNQVVYTIEYANTGNTTLTNPVVTDTVPAGFTYVSAVPAADTEPCTNCVWTLAPASLAPGASGSITLTLQANSPYTDANPQSNTATISADGETPVSDDWQVGITGSTCAAATTYYFHDTVPSRTADTTAPTGLPTSIVMTAASTVDIFQSPVVSGPQYIDDTTVNTTVWVQKSGGSITVTLTLIDDDTLGGQTPIGTATSTVTGTMTQQTPVWTAPWTYVLPDGHRLLWRVTSNGNMTFNIDGTAANNGDSRSSVCFTPVTAAFDKQVSAVTAAEGDSLTYTLRYANTAPAGTLTNLQIVDDLPTGVTYSASSIVPVEPTPCDPCTFNIGSLAGGASGSMTVTVTVDTGTTINTLLNSATLDYTETATPLAATAETTVLRPQLSIIKLVDDESLLPGETATFTLRITNAGNGDANNVVVSDTLPNETWLVYGSCTAPAGLTCVDDAPAVPTTLTVTLDDTVMSPGETYDITYPLTVNTVAPLPPSGITQKDNDATIDSDETVLETSNTVTVFISTQPNLDLTLVADTGGPLAPCDVVTYTATVSNSGYANADDVVITNPVPAYTTYVNGTLTYDAASQTDAAGDDSGSYDAILGRLFWDVGTLAPGASHVVTFQAKVDCVLPNGTTNIDDTATATSSNTASVNDNVVIPAVAAPILTLAKTAPATMTRPVTTLNGAQGPTTSLVVNDASDLSTGDYIEVNGTDTRITAVNTLTNTLTLSVAVSGADGASVNPVIPYTLIYQNNGNADATGVVISDPLPAGTVFVAATGGGSESGGTVTWNIGTVPAGSGASVKFWARPTANGTYTNTATLSSNELPDVSDPATTNIGAIIPSKVTNVAAVNNDGVDPKETTQYVLTIQNDTGAVQTGIQIVDTMESGFTFCDSATADATCADPTLSRARDSATSAPVSGDNPLTWCCWDLGIGETLTITFDAKIDNVVGDGTYQNDVDVTDSAGVPYGGALDFDFTGTTAEDVTVTYTGSNYVLVKRFDAHLGGQGVVLDIETDAEIGTVGFELLRWNGFSYDLVGRIPAAGTPQGSRYQVVDRRAPYAGPLYYTLVEITAGGGRTANGFFVDPVAADASFPADGTTGLVKTPRPLAKGKPSGAGPDRGPGVGLRIGVRADGLYRVGADEIDDALGLNAGEASSMIRSGKLRLLLDDREVPWMSEGEGEASGLLFYGQAQRSRTSNERVYRLLPERGPRMQNAAGGVRGSAALGATYVHRAAYEVDAFPTMIGLAEDDAEMWFWDFLYAGFPGWDRKSFALDTPGAAGIGTAELKVHLRGGYTSPHDVDAFLNGELIGDANFQDYEAETVTFEVDGDLLVDGTNTLELRANLAAGTSLSVVLLDRVELRYERVYSSDGTSLLFGSGDQEQLVVDGFTSPDVLLLDVTDPWEPREVRGAEIEGSGAGWQLRFSPSTAGGRYLATTAAGVASPATLRPDYPSDLRSASNWADYVVLTHADLFGAAQELADYREAQGLRSMVVDWDDVMDELNGGQNDPAAIRAFVAHTLTAWQQAPRYLVLLGAGNIDYKDAWGLGGNLLPPLMQAAPDGLYAADNALADIDGDGVPEMAVGRIPAKTAADADAYLAKIQAYEAAADDDWMRRVVLAADDPDWTGDYTRENGILAGLLPAGTTAHRVDLETLGPAAARSALLGHLQSGTSLVTWVGHGGLTQLAHEGVLTSDQVPLLHNGERLPVLAALSCYVGDFVLPGFTSLSESLVLHDGGGMAAVWAASGISYNHRRVLIGQAFLGVLAQPGEQRLGDAVLGALRAAAQGGLRGDRNTLASQVLLGDPALRLRIAP